MQYVERYWESQDWVTVTLVGCLLLLAVARYLYPKRFQEFILLPITDKYFLVQAKNNRLGHPFNALLFAVQVVAVSLLIYSAFAYYSPDVVQSNSWLFVQICTAYTVFVIAKFCIEKIVGAVFALDEVINEYLFEKLSYRNLIAILLVVVNIIFFYIVDINALWLWIILAAVLVFNAIALFYSYKNNRNLISRHFFYFILYLCALEISPYVLLYKWWELG